LRALAFSLQSKAFDVEAWVGALVSWYSSELKTETETRRTFRREAKATLLELVRNSTAKK